MPSSTPLVRRTVVVGNPPLGLHVRPATEFVKTARRFRCTVWVVLGEKRANGQSPFDLLSLFAPTGTELILEVNGEDAEAAAQALEAVLTAHPPDTLTSGS
jgi:phosphotransferase system HPr (HPr) family protein